MFWSYFLPQNQSSLTLLCILCTVEKVIDTGIDEDYRGGSEITIAGGANFISATQGANAWNDWCNGHGTHVAGTIGSRTYGVAPGVTLWAVRVLGCDGSGTYAGVISGVDWCVKKKIEVYLFTDRKLPSNPARALVRTRGNIGSARRQVDEVDLLSGSDNGVKCRIFYYHTILKAGPLKGMGCAGLDGGLVCIDP